MNITLLKKMVRFSLGLFCVVLMACLLSKDKGKDTFSLEIEVGKNDSLLQVDRLEITALSEDSSIIRKLYDRKPGSAQEVKGLEIDPALGPAYFVQIRAYRMDSLGIEREVYSKQVMLESGKVTGSLDISPRFQDSILIPDTASVGENSKNGLKLKIPELQIISEGDSVNIEVSVNDSVAKIEFRQLPPGAMWIKGQTVNKSILQWRPNYKQGQISPYALVVLAFKTDTDTVYGNLQIQVNNKNRTPKIQEFMNPSAKEGDSVKFKILALDPDEDSLLWSIDSLPQAAIFSKGEFSWLAPLNSKNYSFNVKVSDGMLEDTRRVTLSIGNVNRPPRLLGIADTVINEGQILELNLIGEDDNSSQKLHFKGIELPAGSQLDTSEASQRKAKFKWSISENAGRTQPYVLSLEINDGDLSELVTATITVKQVKKNYSIEIISPKPGQLIADSIVTVKWNVDGLAQQNLFKSLPKEGENEIQVEFRDSRNIAYTKSVKVIRDLKAPLPPIVQVPASDTSGQPEWSWISAGGGMGFFRWKLDQENLSTGADSGMLLKFTPITVIANGSHFLNVQERDSAGNWSLSGKATVLINSNKLAAPTVIGPSLSKSDKPTWSWSSAGGTSVFRIRLDSTELKSSPETKTTTFTSPNELTQGDHTLYVQEKDNINRWSPSGQFTIRVDKVAPSKPAITGSGWTNLLDLEWTLVSTSGEAGAKLYWSVGAPDTSKAVLLTGNTIKKSIVNEGDVTLYAWEKDEAGNFSDPAFAVWKVDITAPPAPKVNGSGWSQSQNLTWTVSTNSLSNPGSLWYKINNTDFSKSLTAVPFDGKVKYTSLGESEVTLYAIEIDQAGNRSTMVSGQFKVDTIPPLAPVFTSSITVTNQDPLWSWKSGGGGNGHYQFGFSEAEMKAATEEMITNKKISMGTGAYTLWLREKDEAGNWSLPSKYTINVDKTAPLVELVSPLQNHVTIKDTVIVKYKVDGIQKSKNASLTLNANNIILSETDAAGNNTVLNVSIYRIGGVVFVNEKASGKNDGSSWADAFKTLYEALKSGKAGEYWVARGTYLPDESNGSVAAVFKPTAVQSLYGGFVGIEKSRSERNWYSNKTYLSGETGNKLIFSDNAGNTVNLSSGTLLDGFVIIGNADYNGGTFGGVLIEDFDATIRNCWFPDPHGVSLIALLANPKISNCVFQNKSGIKTYLSATPVIENSILVASIDVEGAGMTFVHCALFQSSIIISESGDDAFRVQFVNTGISSSNISVSTTNFPSIDTIRFDNCLLENGIPISSKGEIVINNNSYQGNASWNNPNDVDGPDNQFPSDDDGFTLLGSGEGIDFGGNSSPGIKYPSTDIRGKPRLLGFNYDIGPYETK